MPNLMTPDGNTNEKLDILRCKINNSKKAYLELARNKDKLMIEIYREDISLINFCIPWNTRVQSSYLNHPIKTINKSKTKNNFENNNNDTNNINNPKNNVTKGGSKNPFSTVFDPWKGFNKNAPGVWGRDTLYMCVPGLETPPSKKVAYLFIYIDILIDTCICIFIYVYECICY